MHIEIAQPTYIKDNISAPVSVDGRFLYRLTSQEKNGEHHYTLTTNDAARTVIARTTTHQRYNMNTGRINSWVVKRVGDEYIADTTVPLLDEVTTSTHDIHTVEQPDSPHIGEVDHEVIGATLRDILISQVDRLNHGVSFLNDWFSVESIDESEDGSVVVKLQGAYTQTDNETSGRPRSTVSIVATPR